MASFCHEWTPGFALLARPLYDAIKGPDEEESLLWTKAQEMAFQTLKTKLSSTRALALLYLEKPFTSYVTEKQGQALGILT